jgi:hypothetical protein
MRITFATDFYRKASVRWRLEVTDDSVTKVSRHESEVIEVVPDRIESSIGVTFQSFGQIICIHIIPKGRSFSRLRNFEETGERYLHKKAILCTPLKASISFSFHDSQ